MSPGTHGTGAEMLRNEAGEQMKLVKRLEKSFREEKKKRFSREFVHP